MTAAGAAVKKVFQLIWQPVLVGAIAGVGMRLFFSGEPGGAYAAMMGSFVFLCPMFVGAVTVFLAERKARRPVEYYIWASALANILFVFATIGLMIEGWICAIIIAPVFVTLGTMGGLLMGVVCRMTMWPNQMMLSLAVLPLALGGVEAELETPTLRGSVERAVTIRAAPEVVWKQIMEARDIRSEEMDRAWIFRIGVPLPLAGVVQQSPEGPVRKITMGKGVHFDQVFTASEENRYVHWRYRIYKDSFPPYALDDHVLVGGYYFDVPDTSYTLTPKGAETELRIKMGYRVTTQFNWYSGPLARYLLGNFEDVVLDFYRRRSEGA